MEYENHSKEQKNSFNVTITKMKEELKGAEIKEK